MSFVKAAFGIGKSVVGGALRTVARNKGKSAVGTAIGVATKGFSIVSHLSAYYRGMAAGSSSMQKALMLAKGASVAPKLSAVSKVSKVITAEEKAFLPKPGALSIKHTIRDKHFANEREAKDFIIKRLEDH